MTDAGPNPLYADRYSVHYSVYGATLDVEGLLAEQPPGGDFETWHKGASRGPQRVTKNAGVRIQVIEDGHPAEVAKAIERFLSVQRPFLEAVAKQNGDVTSLLSCAMWVYSKVPSTISLSGDVLRQMGELRVGWEVTGYPCADKEGP